MDSRYFSLLDMAIVAVPALAFGIWQLVSVNRAIAKDRADKCPKSPSPKSAGHSIGEHRLDDR